jgi:hypothetical protein
MSKQRDFQLIVDQYRDMFGDGFTMKDVAEFGLKKGWLPQPSLDPIEHWAKKLAKAAREETGYDEVTRRPYRLYQSYRGSKGGVQADLWGRTDGFTWEQREKSFKQRREQITGEIVALTDDADHCNRIHPEEERHQIELDFGPDVAWRKSQDDAA